MAGRIRLVAQEARFVERALEMREQVHQFLLCRWPRRMIRHALCRRVLAGGRPFVSDQQHRLGDVQRGELRVERNREHRVGVDHVVVSRPVRSGPNMIPTLSPCPTQSRISAAARRAVRRALAELAIASGGSPPRARDRQPPRRPCRTLSPDRAPRRRRRARWALGLGQPIAWLDQAQARQAAIQHGARRHTDILAQLWTYQDDHRRRAHRHAALRSPTHGVL